MPRLELGCGSWISSLGDGEFKFCGIAVRHDATNSSYTSPRVDREDQDATIDSMHMNRCCVLRRPTSTAEESPSAAIDAQRVDAEHDEGPRRTGDQLSGHADCVCLWTRKGRECRSASVSPPVLTINQGSTFMVTAEDGQIL